MRPSCGAGARLDVAHERWQQFVADGSVSPEALAVLHARHEYRAGRLPATRPTAAPPRCGRQIRMELIAAEREFIYRLLATRQITDEGRRRIDANSTWKKRASPARRKAAKSRRYRELADYTTPHVSSGAPPFMEFGLPVPLRRQLAIIGLQ